VKLTNNIDKFPIRTPGWYKDPVQGKGERYFDGHAWTSLVRGQAPGAVVGGGTPGWYKDPSNKRQIRYFDGHNWTDRVADISGVWREQMRNARKLKLASQKKG
jgi:hypothetical protein